MSDNDHITFSGMIDREKHIDTSQVAFINLNDNFRNRSYTWQEEEVTSAINTAVAYKHNFSTGQVILYRRICNIHVGWKMKVIS